MSEQKFVEISESFFIDREYETAFNKLGLTSIEAIFAFDAAQNLTKAGLPEFRSRMQFDINRPGASAATTVFLKRYVSAPVITQLRNWLAARRHTSCAYFTLEAAIQLTKSNINTLKIIAYGQQWGVFLEKRSFIIAEKIPNADSLERKLPEFFSGPATINNLRLRRSFIAKLAAFVRKFHQTNYRHRDLYFSHIFYGNSGEFYLIDLARAFRPVFLGKRFQIKDIAQVHYSAPGRYFSRTDRLRFYTAYTGHKQLTGKDKAFIRKVISKANRMARHDRKHGRTVPFST